jgi:nicotinate-nucleotide adenylyltransferase
MKKIGIFAGVFDPIHLGHTYFIEQSVKKYALDKVYVMVEQEPRYKTCLASYGHRKKMAGLATRGIPQAEIYESESKFFPLTSSLPEIKKANPGSKLFLLLGDDVAAHIKDWQGSGQLLKGVELIIADRKHGGRYAEVSSLKARNKLAEGIESEISPAVLDYCRENGLYLVTGA